MHRLDSIATVAYRRGYIFFEQNFHNAALTKPSFRATLWNARLSSSFAVKTIGSFPKNQGYCGRHWRERETRSEGWVAAAKYSLVLAVLSRYVDSAVASIFRTC